MAAVPILMLSVTLLMHSISNPHGRFADIVIPVGTLPPGLLYILARAATLVLAFISLRDLPSGAYETVHWTTFIPHV